MQGRLRVACKGAFPVIVLWQRMRGGGQGSTALVGLVSTGRRQAKSGMKCGIKKLKRESLRNGCLQSAHLQSRPLHHAGAHAPSPAATSAAS